MKPSTSALRLSFSVTHCALIPKTGSMVATPLNLSSFPPPMFIAKKRSGIMDERAISLPRKRNRYSLGSSSMLSLTPIVGRSIPISLAKLVRAPVILSKRSPPFPLSAKTNNPYPISSPKTSCSIAFSIKVLLFGEGSAAAPVPVS